MIGGSGMLVFMSPSLALLSLVVIPPVGIVAVFYGKYVKKRQKMVQAALGKTMEVRVVVEAVGLHKLLKTTGI